MSRAAVALCVLIAFALAPEGLHAAGPAEPEPVVLKPGDPAPPFLMKTVNEAHCGLPVLTSKKLFGPKVAAPRALVLSFGASYCKPCRAELPHVKALADRYAERAVTFALVIRDEEEAGLEVLRKLAVEEVGVRFPILSDRFSLLARRYGAEELPFLVVVAPDGRVAWVQRGFHADTLELLAATLDRVLPPPAPAPAPGAPTP